MRVVRLFVSYARINLCHCFFSSSWCRGLAAASVCGSSWTFLFTFIHILCKINLAIAFICVRFTISGFYCQIIASRHMRRSLEKVLPVKASKMANCSVYTSVTSVCKTSECKGHCDEMREQRSLWSNCLVTKVKKRHKYC